MARTTDVSIQATGLNRPDTGAASFVRQAPVDTSGIVGSNVTAQALGMQAAGIQTNAQAINQLSQVIPNIVQAGLEVHKSSTLQDLQNAHNVEIDNFLQSQKNPELVQTAKENVATGDLATKSLFNRMEAGTASISQIQDVNAEFAQDTKALTSAVQQGIMQPSELRMRLLKITREHINRNPGLSNELMVHAEKVMALSGISSLRDTKQKLDDSAAKAFQEQKDFLKKEFSKHTIDFDVFQLNDPIYLAEKQDELNKKKRNMAAFDNIIDNDKLRNIKTQQQADDWARTNGPKLLEGGLARFHVDAQGIMQAFAQDQKAIPGAIRDLANQYVAEAADNVGSAVSLASPEGRVHYENYVKMINNVADSLTQIKTGQDAVTVLNNQVKMSSLINEQRLRASGVNPEAFDFAAKYPEIANKWITNNPVIFDRLLRTTSALIFDGNPGDPALIQTMKSSTGEPGVNDAVLLSKNLLQAGRNDEFRKSLSIYKDATKSGNMSQADVFKFFDSFTDAFSQRFMGEQARKGASKEDVINVNEMADQYMQFVGKALNDLTQGKNVQAVEIPGVGVTFKAPGDPKLEKTLQNDYAARVNRMVKTFANIGGFTHSEAWNFVKEQYGSTLKLPQEGQTTGARGQNVNNPGNIKVPGENKFQDFGSTEAGIKAIKNQLMLYQTGQSKAAGGQRLITPEQMLSKYHNPGEKGSVSQDQYLNNISKFSGLSREELSNPIDPNDTETWNDLIYGIVKSESKNSLTQRDVRRALAGM